VELYIAGFLFGLLGSVHCAGMCGPIALALPGGRSGFSFWMGRINYNLGRSITYALMGGVFGLLGFGVWMAGYQEVLAIVGGLVIIGIALGSLFLGKTSWMHIKPFWLPLDSLKKSMGRLLSMNRPSGLLGVGLLNGFLPCGFVYVALAGALASGSVISGMIYMFLFGLGTFPVMFLVSSSNRVLGPNTRVKLQKAIPYAALILGGLLVMRGLSLGIPFLSPDMAAAFTTGETSCH